MTLDYQSIIRVVLTTIFSVISFSALFSYFFLNFGRLYQNRENRWMAGTLAFILPAITTLFGLLTWVLWNPLVSGIFWYLFGFSLFVDYVFYQSAVSPYKAADWWTEFSEWLQKRKTR